MPKSARMQAVLRNRRRLVAGDRLQDAAVFHDFIRQSNQALNATATRSQASLTHPRCRRPCVLPACGAVIARADACGRLGPRGCTTHRRMAMTARRRRLREDLPRRGVAPTPPPGSREAVTHLAPYDQRAP